MQGRRSRNQPLKSPLDQLRANRQRFVERILREEDKVEEELELREAMAEGDEHRREMRDLARPMVATSNSCIQLPPAARNYELKDLSYNMLPSFHGLPNEDPLTFIRDFYATVEHFLLNELNEDQLSTFVQQEGEPFHEAWDRFKLLLIECPPHYYAQELFNQFFYDGLTQQGQVMVDGVAGGTIGNKSAVETYALYEMLGANSQQKSVRGRKANVQAVNSTNDLERQLAQLTKTVEILATAKAESVNEIRQEKCQLYGEFGHSAPICQGSNEAAQCEQANWANANNGGGYNQRGNYDVYSNTYNSTLKHHSNLSWRNNNYQQQNHSFPPYQPPKPVYPPPQQQNF